ncbi:MAG: TonB C-terminal domain-containing protein [Myxococcota bacterium]
MSEAVVQLAAGREREFRRMVALSAALHVALSVAAVISLPSIFEHEAPAGPVISMITPDELAARMGEIEPPARPKPPDALPKPEPVAEPTPPPPKPDLTVIPEDVTQKPTKPKPEAVRDPETRPREPDAEQVDLDDLLLAARLESGAMPGEAKPVAKPRVVPGAGGTGAPLTAEEAEWRLKVRRHVHFTLNLPPGFRGKSLKTLVTVTLTSGGDLLGYEVERSSGNPWYDDQIERYLAGLSAFPPPPRAGDWEIIFDGDF